MGKYKETKDTWFSLSSTNDGVPSFRAILTKEERIARAEGQGEGFFLGVVFSFIGILIWYAFYYKFLLGV